MLSAEVPLKGVDVHPITTLGIDGRGRDLGVRVGVRVRVRVGVRVR